MGNDFSWARDGLAYFTALRLLYRFLEGCLPRGVSIFKYEGLSIAFYLRRCFAISILRRWPSIGLPPTSAMREGRLFPTLFSFIWKAEYFAERIESFILIFSQGFIFNSTISFWWMSLRAYSRLLYWWLSSGCFDDCFKRRFLFTPLYLPFTSKCHYRPAFIVPRRPGCPDIFSQISSTARSAYSTSYFYHFYTSLFTSLYRSHLRRYACVHVRPVALHVNEKATWKMILSWEQVGYRQKHQISGYIWYYYGRHEEMPSAEDLTPPGALLTNITYTTHARMPRIRLLIVSLLYDVAGSLF